MINLLTILLFIAALIFIFLDISTAAIVFKRNRKNFLDDEVNKSLVWYLMNKSNIWYAIKRVFLDSLICLIVFILGILFSAGVFEVDKFLALNLFLFADIFCSFFGVCTNLISLLKKEEKK